MYVYFHNFFILFYFMKILKISIYPFQLEIIIEKKDHFYPWWNFNSFVAKKITNWTLWNLHRSSTYDHPLDSIFVVIKTWFHINTYLRLRFTNLKSRKYSLSISTYFLDISTLFSNNTHPQFAILRESNKLLCSCYKGATAVVHRVTVVEQSK